VPGADEEAGTTAWRAERKGGGLVEEEGGREEKREGGTYPVLRVALPLLLSLPSKQ